MDIVSSLRQRDRERRMKAREQIGRKHDYEGKEHDRVIDVLPNRGSSVIEDYHSYSSGGRYAISAVSGYSGIKQVVGRINLTQREFDQMQRRMNAKGLGKVGYTLYDSAMKFAGKERQYRTDLELFDRQIGNVGELNHILAALTVNGKRELNLLRSRVDKVLGESESALANMKSIEAKLPKHIEALKHKREKLSGMRQSDEGYFPFKREVIDLERGVAEMYNAFRLAQRVYIGSSRHQENLTYMEKLFDTSLNTAANLAVIAKQIGDTLGDNRRVFYECGNLVQASAAVSEGIDLLAYHNRELNAKFIGGVRSMLGITYKGDNVDMIDSTNESLRSLIDYAGSEGLQYDRKIDMLINMQDGRP